MAGRNNPIKYSDLFDISDKSTINEINAQIKKLDKAYEKFADSVKKHADTAREAWLRTVNEMVESSKKLDLALTGDKNSLLELVKALGTLRDRQKTQNQTQQQQTQGMAAAADSVDGLKKRINDLVAEYNKLDKADDIQALRMKQVANEVRELTKEQKELTNALKVGKEAVDYATGSYKALEERTKVLTKELKELPNSFDKTNTRAAELRKEIAANNTKLKEFDATLNIHTRNVGNYTSALAGVQGAAANFATGIAAAYAGFTSLSDFAETVVQSNVELSDSLSDVQRTAELTGKEANNLAESLKKIDTRTTLKGLVDLAVIGGQLGFQTVDDLKGFTKAIDELAVSLAGEIEGGAEKIATGVGKINGVFKVSAKEGETVERAFLKTGSSILKLGQAGLATGENLVDFTERVAAVASNAGFTIPQIQAYGAVLEEAGQSAEVSGTAFQALLVKLAKVPEKFFAVAKAAAPDLTLKKFTEFVNTDMKHALDLFFTGLNKTGVKTTDFAKIVGLLGVEGKKSVTTLTALADNIALTELRTKQATEAYNDGTLATDQFAIKNENLAASLEKAKNAIFNTFTSSSASTGVAKFINNLVEGRTAAEKLTASVKSQKDELRNLDDVLPGLLTKYDDLKDEARELGGTNNLTSEKQKELNKLIQDIATLLPNAITQVDNYGNAIDISRGKIEQLTTAMRDNIKAASQSAAKGLRDDIDERNKVINRMKDIAQTGSRGFGVGMFSNEADRRSQAQEQIAQKALANAEDIKRIRDVLLQDLTPAEQEVYDKFFKSDLPLGGIMGAAKDAKKNASETSDATEQTITDLENLSSHGKRAKTEIEKLEKTVEKLKNTLESQALNGGIMSATLDAFVDKTEKLEAAQRKAAQGINAAIAPLVNLKNEQEYFNKKLERQIGLGQDTTQVTADLATANENLKNKQNEVNLAFSSTVGQMELLNTRIEINRQELEQLIAGDANYSTVLQQLGEDTLEVERVTKLMQKAVLSVTKPMELLAMEADEYRDLLSEQVASGEANIDTIDKYRAAIDALYLAQKKLREASEYDPTDPKGIIKGLGIDLQHIEQQQNGVSVKSENGDPDAIKNYRALEFKKLRITLDRLDEMQKAYKAGTEEYEDLETQKTKITAEQDKLRSDIVKSGEQKRAEFIKEGLELLSIGVNGYYDIEKQKRENELSDIDEKKTKELSIAGNNANAKAKIEEKYAKKIAEIKTKQALADRNEALFNIALQTAQGANKAIADFPETYGMPFLAFVLASGIAQAAVVAARPLPKYAKGRRNGPAEHAILGEQGPEAIIGKDSSVRLTKAGAHVGYLHEGDTVHRADSAETKAIRAMLYGTGIMEQSVNNYGASAESIARAKQSYEIYNYAHAMRSVAGNGVSVDKLKEAFGGALDERPAEHFSFDEGGYSAYLLRKNARIQMLNARNSLKGNG